MTQDSSVTPDSAPVDTTETTQSAESSDTSPVQSAQDSSKGDKQQKLQQQIRKFKLKVNGQQRQLDQKTVIAMAQKGMAADQKFQKSAARQRQLDALFRKAKQDPDAFIKQVIGEDSVEFSKKRLARQLEQLSLDPKQKQLRQYKRKVEQYQKQKAAAQERAKKQSQAKAVDHWTKHYDKVLPDAIKSAGLPLTDDVIRHVTDIMIASLQDGFQLPMQSVMELAKDRYLGSVKKFLTSADKQKLVQLLGQDVVSKLGVSVKKKVAGKVALSSQAQERSQKRVISQSQAERQLQERIKKWASE